MKTIITTTIAALLMTPAFAGEYDNGGNSASANQVQGQIAAAQSGVIYNEGDTPDFSYGVFGQIGSTNNSPCGRTFFGIPASGENCTARMEAQALYNSMVGLYGEKRASQAAILHLGRNDTTMRKTLIAAGVLRRAD